MKLNDSYGNGYCSQCGKRLAAKPSSRFKRPSLIIVNDGFGLYWVFDSPKCCRDFFIKYGYENSGFYSSDFVDQLVVQMRKLNGWRVSRYTTKIVEQLIVKGKLDDE